MMKKLTDRGEATAFYAVTLALMVAVALMPGASTEVAMLTPLVAVVLMLFVVTRDGYTREGLKSLGLHRLGLRAWPVAILGPLAVLGVAYGVVWATGLAEFSVPQALAEQGAGVGMPLWLWVPIATIVGPMLTLGLVLSLGEELGWRGYLLPRLESLGAWAAVLLTGFLHALFHLPIIFLTTLYHPGANKLILVPLFVLSLTVVGMFLGYLRLSTGSVWPAVLGHSAHNSIWAAFVALSAGSTPLASEYLAGESGVLVIVGYAALGGWLMYALTRKKDSSPEALPTGPDPAPESA
jgi:membrane protease YdiL (CAAX protease family)